MEKNQKNQEMIDALKREVMRHGNNVALSVAAAIMGTQGGQTKGPSKRRPKEVYREAVAKRWENYRRRGSAGKSSKKA